MKTLGQLKPGESGVVLRSGSEDQRVKRRLVDMGITPGTEVTVRKVAPMGDPMEINLRGYELSLRQADAQKIQLMEPEEAARYLAEAPERRAGEKQPGSHEQSGDLPQHEKAARLTERVLERQQKGGGGSWADEYDRDHPIKLALVGNPNCGKTTLFNAMTGAREYVGNWPGVTVEKKEGRIHALGHEMTLVDLPGIYSLSPYSMEEVVARNFVIHERPDAVINIVDGTNLERNLYLTVQLMELERPMIIALNMMDEVEKRGDRIDCKRLSLELGIPVVPISARTGQGVEELVAFSQQVIEVAHEQMHEGFHIEPDDLYDDYTHQIHHRLGDVIGGRAAAAGLPEHWAQIKLLEGDTLVREALALPEQEQQAVDAIIAEYAASSELGDNETLVADSRYRYISRVTVLALRRKLSQGEASFSDRIDRILTNKYLAVPIFLLIMLVIFTLTFGTLGAWLSDGVDVLINGRLADGLRGLMERSGAMDWLTGLICDGIVPGVGGVLTFLPQIAILFFFLSLLEDSGYMSRTAFIMDKPLRRFGLSGKSFIPMLMGFGCSVPASMGARTMENEKDRRMTIMLIPFMSCSAKLPVYGLIAGAFFSKGQGLVVLSLYALGILVGILSGLIFRKTLFKGQTAPFVMELPPYRWPTPRNTLLHVWERVKHFLEKAGTIIFAMSVVLWFLENFDITFHMVENTAQSILGVIGGFLAPLFTPLGFGTWQAAVALLAGLVAKEAVVSSLSMFFGFSTIAGAEVIRTSMAGTFTPLSAYSFLVFVLLYVPCMAAVSTMRRELGSGKWTMRMVAWQILAAYVVSLVVYQGGLLLGLG